MNSISGLTATQLRQAADIKERIDALQNQLSALLGGETSTELRAAQPGGKQRKISAAGLRNIRAAQKARWAKAKATAPKRKFSAQAIANIRAGVAKRVAAQGKAAGAKPKVQRSAAWRAAISAAAKNRWAKAKKAGKTRW